MTKTAATHIKANDMITVKGETLTVLRTWYEGRYSKPGAKRMTNMIGFENAAGDIVWVAAHVKVEKH